VAIIHKGRILLQGNINDIRRKAEGAMTDQDLRTLEELFVELVSDKVAKKHLSWL